MRNLIKIIIFLGLLGFFISAQASGLTIPQGGTGWTSFTNGALPYGNPNSLLRFATTTTNNSDYGKILAFLNGIPVWVSTSSITGAAFEWTPATNYNQNVNSTTTPIWFNAPGTSLYASSTAQFDQIQVGTTTATSTFSTGGFTVGTSQFIVQQNSGKVGVGTSSPTNTLGVGGGFIDVGPTFGYKQDNNLILFASSTDLTTFGGISAGTNILAHSTSSALTEGAQSTAFGYQAMQNSTSSQSTAIGYQALQGPGTKFGTATDNTAIGFQALQHLTTGSNNVAIGANSFSGAGGGITGSFNQAIGQSNFNACSSCSNNGAYGDNTLTALVPCCGIAGAGEPATSVAYNAAFPRWTSGYVCAMLG